MHHLVLSAKENLGIAALLLAFLALGTAYSVVIPIFEASDEPGHFQYARYLGEGNGLPVQSFLDEENAVRYGNQPPLYFLLGALTTFWVGYDGLEVMQENPTLGWPEPARGRGVWVHTPAEAFPYKGGFLALHLLRLLSVLMGAGTVLCTYLLAKWILPDRRSLALGAAALNAFVPQFLFVSAVVNNDSLVILLSSIALLVMARVLLGSPSWRLHLLLGLLLGLAALAKTSALALLPLAGALFLYRVFRERGAPPILKGLLALGIFLAVAGWWYLRNWALYGDPLAWGLWRSMRQPLLREAPLAFRDLWEGGWQFSKSFWGMFGWLSIEMHPWVYLLLLLVALLSLAGLVHFLLEQTRLSSPERRTILGLAFSLLAVGSYLGALLPYAATFNLSAFQGRYLFPALPALAFLLIFGLTQLARPAYLLAFPSLAGVMALALLAPFLYIAPNYAPPQPLPMSALDGVEGKTRANFGRAIALLGYQISAQKGRPGETLWVTLYWQALRKVEKDYMVFLHLADRAGGYANLLGDAWPFRGDFPTSAWPVGALLRDSYPLIVSPQAEPGLYRIEAGLYLSGSSRLPILDDMGSPLGDSLVLGWIKVPLTGSLPASTFTVSNVSLEGKVRLMGLILLSREVKPGARLPLTLYWQAEGRLDQDYTVFVHLVDGQGKLWAQQDGQPRGGRYPTSIWESGELVSDPYGLELPPGLPTGPYWLEVGMYRHDSGERLKRLDGSGDKVLLGPLMAAPKP